MAKRNEKIEKDLEALRHSCSHIMAQAVTELFPGVKLAIGPPIADGFYYDFDKKEPFTPQDLEKITEKMKEIIKKNYPFVRSEKSREEALKFFGDRGEKYKVELIEGMDDEKVTIYEQGGFTDLCRGPHVKSTDEVKYFKLLSVAGAYWRGDEKRESLQRIYGTTFFTQEELDKYLYLQEEAKKRDHRKLGVELDLFSMHERAGAGLIYWHPKGSRIRKVIEDFWEDEHLKNGYELVDIPHIARIDLWQTSGHVDFYQEYMYSPMDIEGQKYIIKPMNCPGHILIYKTKVRSYRDLPIRWAELGTVYRYERSGVLHGLMRVRGFTQDDAHIFCRPEQLEDEIVGVIKFVLFMLRTFGFSDYDVALSTRPEKYVGTPESWEKAESALKKALEKVKLAYVVNPGEGVFYGPKIDIKIKDSLGRAWQCSTIQVDFNLPERFDITFIDISGQRRRPIMIHRALLGSLERFFGVLIEHYGGAFPVWLAPVQATVLTITDLQKEYGQKVYNRLKEKSIRVKANFANEKIDKKIRNAQLQKIPYMLIIGKREVESETVAVRRRDQKDLGPVKVNQFIEDISEEIKNRR
ncbi:threonine--tRNA ligase [bacterium]|nr:threonine--tRNA ligase [bacterium]